MSDAALSRAEILKILDQAHTELEFSASPTADELSKVFLQLHKEWAQPSTPPCAVCNQASDTDLGVCSKCIRNNPTRLMVTRRCDPCSNEWLSAATTGACPRCHSAEGCRTIQIRANGLKRL